MTETIILPDFEAKWKWSRQINPHTEAIRQDTLEWTASFKAFSSGAQEAFDNCNFNLLTGLLYPWVTREQLRCANDLMNLFFLFDEHSDNSEAKEVWSQVSMIMDALRNPHKRRPEGEWVGSEVARQFWARTCAISTPTFQRRFIVNMQDYLNGTAQQAEDRGSLCVRNIDSYFDIRRKTIGVLSSFNMLEMDTNTPDEVYADPVIRKLIELAVDLTIIVNDVLSYNKEQAAGDDKHNLVTVVMWEKRLSTQAAIDWAAQLYDSMADEFNALFRAIPRWGGPLDWHVQTFMNGVAQWVIGHLLWSYEGERYFGKNGLETRVTRTLRLSQRM